MPISSLDITLDIFYIQYIHILSMLRIFKSFLKRIKTDTILLFKHFCIYVQ